MAKTEQKKAPAETTEAIEKRWGKPLTSAGWTALPNVLFERAQSIGLEPLDIVIILHLASYWWKADNEPHPSKVGLANAIGVTPRTIQRRIAALEKAKLIERIPREAAHGGNLTNRYSLKGLIQEAVPYAKEHLAERAERQREAIERPTRKRPRAVGAATPSDRTVRGSRK